MAGRPPKAEQTDKCTDNLHISSKNKPHKNRTILGRAAEEGVSPFTIGQNQKFAQGVDAVREVSPELAEHVLGDGALLLSSIDLQRRRLRLLAFQPTSP